LVDCKRIIIGIQLMQRRCFDQTMLKSKVIEHFCKTVFIILLFSSENYSYPRTIPIGIIYREGETAITEVINYIQAKRQHEEQKNMFKLDIRKAIIPKSDVENTWILTKTVCDLLKQGVFAILAKGDIYWHSTLAAVSKEMQVPFINWMLPPRGVFSQFEVSMVSSFAEVVAEIINKKHWKQITFMYENAESLTALHEINMQLSNIASEIDVDLHRLPDVKKKFEFETFFNAFHKTYNAEGRVIVLHVSSVGKIENIVKALQSTHSSARNCHYLIASAGVSEVLMEGFKDGTLNITAVQLVSNQNWLYTNYAVDLSRRLKLKNKLNLFTSEVAFVHDSVMVITNAIEQLLKKNYSMFYGSFRRDQFWNSGYPGIYCLPSEDSENPDRPFKTFDFGRVIAKQIRQTQIEGLSGAVEFDQDGRRSIVAANVIEVQYSGKTLVTSFTKSMWKQNVGLLTDQSTVNFKRANPKEVLPRTNVTRIVTTTLNAPFVMYRKDADHYEGNEKFEGYCVDLLKLISEKIDNFPYRIQLAKDGRTGSPDANGNWDGMIGELLRGEADLAVSSLVSNRARERVVDFSKPFMTTGISIMIKKPDNQYQSGLFSFMQPLSIEVWMYIVFAYIGISVVLFMVSRFSPSEWKFQEANGRACALSNDFSVYNCLWFTLAAFMQQGIDILPRSLPGRIASSAWWFFTLIIVSSYTANLAAFLTLEKMHAPIESVEDMAKQTKIKYGIQAGGTTAQFFKESTVQTYQRMWQFMISQSPSIFVNSYDEGIQRVRESKGRYAFLLEATTNDYTNNRKPCDTMKVGGNLNTVGYGVATPFGSDLKSRINLAILELQEKGDLKMLENKWWYEKSGGQCKTSTSGNLKTSLTHNKVAGIFYILMVGMLVAMFITFVEFLHRARVHARKQRIDLWSSMVHFVTIAIRGKPPAVRSEYSMQFKK
ncbi:Glutamate receptor 1, partial [Trichinella britovi]